MATWQEIIPERLQITFSGEPQRVTASNLKVEQTTISKWINGKNVPTIDLLIIISKIYHVSLDWLLGLSEKKEIDEIPIEKLTYEQTALVLHRLLEMGIIEIPDLNQFAPTPEEDTEPAPLDELEEDQECIEQIIERVPKYDSDFLKINDRALSFMLRRRMKLEEFGEDYLETWIESEVKRFAGLRLLEYSERIQAAIDALPWPNYKAGDWASQLKAISQMNEEQLDLIANYKKEGKDNG